MTNTRWIGREAAGYLDAACLAFMTYNSGEATGMSGGRAIRLCAKVGDSIMGRMSRYIKAVHKRAAERVASGRETPPRTPVIFTEVGRVAVEIDGVQALGVDRRAGVRRVCRREALSQPRTAARGRVWEATLQNISARGVGFLLKNRCRPGTILQIDLRNTSCVRSLVARVLHACAEEGEWFHGCELLNPLTAAELHGLASGESDKPKA